VPALGSRFYTFLANDVIIWALFATSLNPPGGLHRSRLLRPRRVLRRRRVRDRHLDEEARAAVRPWRGRRPGVFGAACALLFGFFCVRLTRIYFAMLTLAFAQIVWAICFKWNELTGGEQGMPGDPLP
jgi:branched-chain amino acid transport system permease protein